MLSGRIHLRRRGRQPPPHRSQHLGLDPVSRPRRHRREQLQNQVTSRIDRPRADREPGQARRINTQEPAQPLNTRPERGLVLADHREGVFSRHWRQSSHGHRPCSANAVNGKEIFTCVARDPGSPRCPGRQLIIETALNL
jgi:hypothetical protein